MTQQATAVERNLAETIAFWHGQRMSVSHPRRGMLTHAAVCGYGSGADGAQRYARDRWQEYLAAAKAMIEHFTWQPIDTAPRNGTTIEIHATMRVHYFNDAAAIAPLPRNWRPDTPQSEWVLQGWRETPVAETGGNPVRADEPDGTGETSLLRRDI